MRADDLDGSMATMLPLVSGEFGPPFHANGRWSASWNTGQDHITRLHGTELREGNSGISQNSRNLYRCLSQSLTHRRQLAG